MIEVAIKITVTSDKQKEVFQTFKAILSQVRREQGCLSCNCYVDMEAENSLYFKEEWASRVDLNTHLRSVNFGILIGAMKLLNKEPEIKINTIASTMGAEAIKTARS